MKIFNQQSRTFTQLELCFPHARAKPPWAKAVHRQGGFIYLFSGHRCFFACKFSCTIEGTTRASFMPRVLRNEFHSGHAPSSLRILGIESQPMNEKPMSEKRLSFLSPAILGTTILLLSFLLDCAIYRFTYSLIYIHLFIYFLVDL